MDNNVQNVPPVNQMPIPNPYYVPKQPKVYKPLDKKDYAFVGLYLLASFLMVCFGLFGDFHLGFSIAYVVLFTVTTAYLFKKGAKPSLFTWLCGGLSLAGAVTFVLFNDYLINLIMVILVAGLYCVYSLGLSDSFNHNVGSFKMLFDLAKDVFSRPFSNMPDVFGGIKASASKGKKSLAAVVGVAVSVPFVIIIGALLVKSDAAFEGLVSKMFKNVGIYLLQFLIAVVILPYLYSHSFGKRHSLNKNASSKLDAKKKAPVSACVSFLAMISVLYVVYLFSQLAYFFSAFKGILPADYTHTASAFARRGFFEMFAICAINVVIISVATAISSKKSLWIKLLSCFISSFSVLLIITAMQKMKLNVSIYGLTKNRVMVSVFMLMMLVVIAFFIIHIFAPKISYMQPIIIVCSAMFIALSFANIDARIPEYNIKAYESGSIQTLDVDSLANLSDSAVPYLVELSKDSRNPVTAHNAAVVCANLMEYNYSSYFDSDSDDNKDFRHFNNATMQAVLALDDLDKDSEIYHIYELMGDNYYNDDNDYFEVYNENNDGDYKEYHYNYKTHRYDIITNSSGEEI